MYTSWAHGRRAKTFGPRARRRIVGGSSDRGDDMHVAITGASSGIGEALAREYVRAGARVTLVARRRELLDTVAASLPAGSTFVIAADLGAPERAAEFVAPAEEALGPIDVLVNNAGMQVVAPIAETSV